MSKKLEPIINPVDGEKVTGDTSRYIRKLRRVRINARKAMRSGNPAKRAEAARVAADAPELVRSAYRSDLTKRAK